MTKNEYFHVWCEIQRLIENSLGLAMLGDYDCASGIIDPGDCQLARDGAVGASVVLLKKARILLETIDPSLFTFEAEQENQS